MISRILAHPLVKETLPEALKAVAPLLGVACVLQVVLVQAPAGLFVRFLAGLVLIVAGMMLLFAGIEMGILPMGGFIGAALPERGSLTLILAVVFALAFATTVAEPDVLVLVDQVEQVSGGALSARVLVYVIAGGVGVFAAIALLRVVLGLSMAYVLTAIYGVMIALSFLAPADFVPLAYDAGSVTTGVLTAPVILALTLGFNSVLADRSAVSDGFGLLGLASVGPVIAILLLGMLR